MGQTASNNNKTEKYLIKIAQEYVLHNDKTNASLTFLQLGELYQKRKEWKLARKAYDDAWTCDYYNLPVIHGYIQCLIELDKNDKAMELLQGLAYTYPELDVKSRMFRAINDILNYNSEKNLIFAAETWLQVGREDQALLLYRTLAQKDIKNTIYYYFMAGLCALIYYHPEVAEAILFEYTLNKTFSQSMESVLLEELRRTLLNNDAKTFQTKVAQYIKDKELCSKHSSSFVLMLLTRLQQRFL